MENEIIQRLKRVNDSMNSKNDKLKNLNLLIKSNNVILEELRDKKKLLKRPDQLDFEIIKQKLISREYLDGNSNLLLNIDRIKLEIKELNSKRILFSSKLHQIAELIDSGKKIFQLHCDNINELALEVNERILMVKEDFDSTNILLTEITKGSKISTRVVDLYQIFKY
jgi:hypothetical protein